MNSKIYIEGIKIPKERIAVLLGIKGRTKRNIESKTNTRLVVDSREGDIEINGWESLDIILCKQIIYAIARGFNPRLALQLLDEENTLEVVDITDYTKKSKKRLIILRARLIGTKGKAKNLLEQLTGTAIEVYGKTAAVIGNQENVLLAKQAIINLLQGSKHGNVYAYISKHKHN